MIQLGTVSNCTFFTASFFEERFLFCFRSTWGLGRRRYEATQNPSDA